jgi:ABC-2 type transport system ATP-binding protein
MSENVLEVQNLTKRYDGTTVVKGISFAIARGEIFGLLGPNGAGKTTTILMLLGLSEISDGQARVLGHDPAREPLQVKRRVGYMPDQVGFYDNMTAGENLRYTARLIGIDRSEREDRIAAALAHVGLLEFADRRVTTFSRGMRQRLGLAEILMKNAEIAILDEPTSGLDPLMAQAFRHAIESLRQQSETTVFLSSHVLSEVESLCERIGLVRAGKMVASEAMDALKQRSTRLVTLDFRAPVEHAPLAVAGATVRGYSARQWIFEVSGPLGPLLEATRSLPIHDLQIEPFKLEDYIASFYGVGVKA